MSDLFSFGHFLGNQYGLERGVQVANNIYRDSGIVSRGLTTAGVLASGLPTASTIIYGATGLYTAGQAIKGIYDHFKG